MQTRTSILKMDPAFSMESPLLQAQPKERCKPPSTTPSVLRQVIGFNPIPRKENEKPASGPLHPFPAAGKTVLQEMQGKSPRSSISPRSALQTLLAAARQEEGKEEKSTSLSSTLKSSALHETVEIGSIKEKTEWEQNFAESFVQNASISSTMKQSSAISDAKGVGCISILKKESAWMSVSHQPSSHVHKDLELLRSQEAHDCQPVAFDPVASERKRSNTQQFLFVATSPVTDGTLSTLSVDFLDACYLCKRRLGQGFDIFMYRGDKAFCSVECRNQQIAMDERKEKHSPSLLRSGSATPARQERRRRSVLAGTAAAG